MRSSNARRQLLLLADALEKVLLVLVVVLDLAQLALHGGRVHLLLHLGKDLGLEVREADLEERARDLVRERVGDELRVQLGRVDAKRAGLERL